MLKMNQRETVVRFLHSLQTEQGGFKNTLHDPGLPQPSLSVIKALDFFGHTPHRPDDLFTYITSLYDKATGGFLDPSTGKPSVFSTAIGLLILHGIGAKGFLNDSVMRALAFMSEHATSCEEHFMLIGVIDECKVPFHPTSSILFFRQMEEEDGSFGNSVLYNAIAASALLRIKQPLKNPKTVKSLLLSGQVASGGFANEEGKADLWTTYCVMRALDLLQVRPQITSLTNWIMEMCDGHAFALPNQAANANTTYQCVSILNWICEPVLHAAKCGDVTMMRQWLEAGGDPDITDLQGWTPLMAASVRGQAEIVKLLLSDDNPNAKKADCTRRLDSADASAIFWAGQSGEIETVKLLLRDTPEQIYDISLVNGHNILLQAAFFGSEKHLTLAKWLLEDIGKILSIPKENIEEIEQARLKLTTATNVRGYNGLTMSKLWGNKEMEALFTKYDKSTEQERASYLEKLLTDISIPTTVEESQLKQQLTDRLIHEITNSFKMLNDETADDIEAVKQHLLERMNEILAHPEFDMNCLGGPLSETPIIAAITGVDTSKDIADFRLNVVTMLLEHGADPDIPEKHPMAVDAVIRAAVLNHFPILKKILKYMKSLAFQAALNEKPSINGQTALQDTVHRALTASEDTLQSHLEQIIWCISKGARYDIEDHTGTSPEKLARKALQDSVYKSRALDVMEALGIKNLSLL
ncbi:ankyrin repeat domain-containing protein [Bacillus solimangrovi]|uniref:Uncharacterized protein n=1 Tax=Bacillus solimangrovi TaxID=1305675 RepID=A0A1E5LIC1_9BACI|nr:ankyrin repeat domain-containing protein [Bacillus solimangrovi]OEH93834.1 hypothetical protein BFG57_10965 [Bacillus solimangrovi]